VEYKVYQPAQVPVRADGPAIEVPWPHALDQNQKAVYVSGRTHIARLWGADPLADDVI